MDEKRALDRLVNDFKTIEQALLSVKRGHDTNEGNWCAAAKGSRLSPRWLTVEREPIRVNQLERYRIAISKVDAAARRIQTSGGGALAALRQNAAVPTGKPHLPDVGAYPALVPRPSQDTALLRVRCRGKRLLTAAAAARRHAFGDCAAR